MINNTQNGFLFHRRGSYTFHDMLQFIQSTLIQHSS